jgi:S-adenosylmethionine synthetase
MELAIERLETLSPAQLPVEIVERKGLGHPDTICDALAENLSIELSRFYLERFGSILHHNVDKALLCGGVARPAFGGGEVLEPIEIYLAGRATIEHGGVRIPVDEIAIEASRTWLKANLRYLDVDRHVRIHPRIRATSSELATLFLGRGHTGAALANDTSFGTGFAPFDALETTVYAAEQVLNAPNVKATHPWIGEDVKVMGARHDAQLRLTVACALVGRHVANLSDYQKKKADARALVLTAVSHAAGTEVGVEVNTADGETPDRIYLTVTGLSGEAGDDGQVGRGNRVNGLITPYRPMSLEAAAGKNPVSHVGKLYNVLANRIARAVVAQVNAVEQVDCYMLSQIGHPIDDPQLLDIKVRVADPGGFAAVRPQIAEVARGQVAAASSLWRDLIEGRLLGVWDGRS